MEFMAPSARHGVRADWLARWHDVPVGVTREPVLVPAAASIETGPGMELWVQGAVWQGEGCVGELGTGALGELGDDCREARLHEQCQSQVGTQIGKVISFW